MMDPVGTARLTSTLRECTDVVAARVCCVMLVVVCVGIMPLRLSWPRPSARSPGGVRGMNRM
eukprot:2143-Eustigmatos_ZCMA.PRE.1